MSFEHDGIELCPLAIPTDEFEGFYEGLATPISMDSGSNSRASA